MKWNFAVASLLALSLLSACKQELSAEEQAAKDEEAIAAVEAAQIVPPTPVSPQAITFDDIKNNDLFGAGCIFRPAEAPEDNIAIAMERAGYMKIDEKIVRLAPDAGSPELPLGARGKYDGRDYVFILDIATEEGERSGMETVDYPAVFVVKNERDQKVYETNGVAQCGS